MRRSEAMAALSAARVGRLATIREDGRPHLVPVAFAVMEDLIVTMIDHKPKTTARLRRLDNIRANPEVSLLVDHYSEDWERLWWVRVDGTASIHTEDEMWQRGRRALGAKYPQYATRPPSGPAIVIVITGVTSWESSS